jgi:pyruvate ferredoxin oxidoreductase gamma subunit
LFQVRIHGRGGQGVVSAAEMLSVAAFDEGCFAQAFPSFGSERMGAPVMAFCRIDAREIRLREPVMQPDALIIQDPTLLHQVDLFSGLADLGFILINSTRDFESLGIGEIARRLPRAHACAVPATDYALRHVGRAVPNAALLGGFAAMTGQLKLESVLNAIAKKFSGKVAEGNIEAARAAYDTVLAKRAEETAIA